MWCKIWRFFLRLFESSVEMLAFAIDTIGRASIDVLSEVVELGGELIGNVGDAIFGDGSFSTMLVLGVVGVVAWKLLFAGSDDNSKQSQPMRTVNPEDIRAVQASTVRTYGIGENTDPDIVSMSL